MALDPEVSLQPGDTKRGLMEIGRELKNNGKTLFGLVAVFWVLEILDTLVFMGGLDSFGVRPRAISGLGGIIAAPFLHGGFGHLISNTVPFLALGGLIMLRDRKDWVAASVMSALVGGLGTWLVGASNSVHIGASGVIFGYFGYLVSVGYYERRITSILLSIFVAFSYGYMIFGVLPMFVGSTISWEGHLFGFLGGIMSAKMLYGGKKKASDRLLTS